MRSLQQTTCMLEVALMHRVLQPRARAADAIDCVRGDRAAKGSARGAYEPSPAESGAALVDALSTSTLYHVFLAFMDALRVLDKE